MVQFAGLPSDRYTRLRALFLHDPAKGGGFPHSEIPGSKEVCSSPGLIAACHVLLRLLMPRHPLCALDNLTVYSVLLDYFNHTSSSTEYHFIPKRFISKICLSGNCPWGRNDLTAHPINLLAKTYGDGRGRTGDLLLAKQAFSQLNYIPVWAFVESNHAPLRYQHSALTN